MIVEDETIVAMDISMTLEGEGILVVGPHVSVSGAMGTLDKTRIDAAVLDVDLQGERVFPVADRLVEREVPFIFHTGARDLDMLRVNYPHAPIITKPADPRHIIEHLDALLEN